MNLSQFELTARIPAEAAGSASSHAWLLAVSLVGASMLTVASHMPSTGCCPITALLDWSRHRTSDTAGQANSAK